MRGEGPQREESSKIEPRWGRGVFPGFLRKTNEHEIWDGEANDIFTARCVDRLVRGKRFCAEALTGAAKTPHDGRVAQHAPPVFQDIPAVPPPEVKPGRAARGFDIYKKDVERFGYTAEGCAKCARALRYGWDESKQYSHSPACRLRFRNLFQDSAADKHRVEEAERKHN